MNRLFYPVVLLLIGMACVPSAFARDENNTSAGLTAVGAPLGLHGSDPVALVNGKRINGIASHTATEGGIAYYFANQRNLDAFKKSPQRYVPQNGGFCTFGVSVGKKFDGDPRYSSVQDGKLFLFLNEDIFKEFQKDRSGTIAKATANWSRIEHLAASAL